MKNKNYILFSLVVLVSLGSFAQVKLGLGVLTNADKKYEEFAYPEAIELYEYLAEKGDTSIHVVRRLADSYRLILKPKQAVLWYDRLMKMTGHTPQEILNFSSTLRSLGRYEASDFAITKYGESFPDDSRVKRFKEELDYLKRLKGIQALFAIDTLGINSSGEDFPTAFYEDKLIFLSSKRNELGTKHVYSRNQEGFIDIYEVSIDTSLNDSTVLTNSGVRPFSDELNTFTHEGPLSFSADRKEVFFTRNNVEKIKLGRSENGVTHLKIFRAKLINNEWTNITEFKFNDKEYSVGHPTLANNDLTIYFVSNKPGGIGGTDIYKSDRKDLNSGWETPVNLGKSINTEGNELFPFVHSKGNLYFSSDGHMGFGGLDVYSYNLSDTTHVTRNLGNSLNGMRDDFAFILSDDRKTGFFASNRLNGSGADDIYSFKVNPIIKKELVAQELLDEMGFDTTSFEYNKLSPDDNLFLKMKLDDLSFIQDSTITIKLKYGQLGMLRDTIFQVNLNDLSSVKESIFKMNLPKEKLGLLEDIFSSIDLNVDNLYEDSSLTFNFRHNKLLLDQDSLINVDFSELGLLEDGSLGIKLEYRKLDEIQEDIIVFKLSDDFLLNDSIFRLRLKYGKLNNLKDTLIFINLNDPELSEFYKLNLPKEKLGLMNDIIHGIQVQTNKLIEDSSVYVSLRYDKLKMQRDSLINLEFKELGLQDDGSYGLELIYQENQKERVFGDFIFFGSVLEEGTNQKLSDVEIIIEDKLRPNSLAKYTTDQLGEFSDIRTRYELDSTILFNISIKKEGYIERNVHFGEELDRFGEIDLNEYLNKIKLTKTEIGVEIGTATNLDPIFFDVNKSDIRPDAEIELDRIVKILKELPNVKIELGSHTDSRGRDGYNLELSQLRARSTTNYLVRKGIERSRIIPKGFGETKLLNRCEDNVECTLDEHAANRRTEFVIIEL